jgi:parvulin-like peptidyl-prolyl isomerase
MNRVTGVARENRNKEKIMTIKVDGQEIPEDAINYELSRLIRFYSQHMPEEQIKQNMPQLKERAVEQAIGAKLLLDQANKMDFEVSGADIDGELAKMIEQAGGEEAFNKIVEEQKMDVEEIKKTIKEGKKVDKLVEQIATGAAEPTVEEIQEHFEANKDQFNTAEQAEAKHILIKPAGDDEEAKSAARVKIEELKKQIEEGADFSKLAEEHSECPSGKQGGGSLGSFGRGMMVPEFDAAVFSMEIGAMSDIIETQFGYHIIMKTGETEASSKDFAEVEPQIKDMLRHSKRGQLIGEYVEELKSKATIEDVEEEAK